MSIGPGESALDPLALSLPQSVEGIGAAVEAAGGRAFVVGGSVRDHLLGHPVKDWDIEVHGVEMAALERLLRRLGPVNAVGKSFGVFKLTIHGEELDISVPRRDNKVGPGHRGIAVEGDPHMGIEEAVRRRDLTINAMMVHIPTRALHDPSGGRADIEARVLRAVDRSTFLEDPLRALRAVQFAARFDFAVHPDLVDLCVEAQVEELPPERILGEMAKLFLRGIKPSRGLELLRRTQLADRLFPERIDDPTLDDALNRLTRHPRLHPPARQLARALVVWLAHTAPPAAVQTLDRLGTYRWDGAPCREPLLAAHTQLDARATDDAQVRNLSTRCELHLLLTAQQALHPSDPRLTDALERAARLGVLTEPPARLIQGRDLIQLGLRPGRHMGQIIKALYQRQLDGELTDRDEALTAAATEIQTTKATTAER